MTDHRKLLLIVNPISGSIKKKGLAEKAFSALSSLGYDVTVRFTEVQGHATALAADAAQTGFHAVVACGGDGTVNEAASALVGSEVALGIIPAGSGNGLARHLGIRPGIDGAVGVINQNNILSIDHATVNGRPFFCTFGLGFDAAVSHKFALQPRRGLMSYIKSALEEYIKYRSSVYTIIADDRKLTDTALILACCNASQYGNNAFIAPKAKLTDGKLDLIIVHESNPIATAILGLELFTKRLDSNPRVQSIQVENISICCEHPEPAHLDGEPIEPAEQFTIKCHPSSLRIFSPLNRML